MKKLTLSVVAAGLATASLGAYAAVPTGAAPFQVVVPNLKSGLEFTLQGLYLQPSNSDLAYLSNQTITKTGRTYNVHSVKPNYNFGFGVGVGYVFPNSGNDMQLNWTHFNHDSSDSSNSTNYIDPPVPGITDIVNSKVSFKYDAVDLDMGQYLSMGTRLQTRLFAGLRFAQLRNDVTNSEALAYTVDSTKVAIVGDQTMDSKFTGIGPRLGIDTSYHLGNCFGVVAHFATALLVGKVESSASHVDSLVIGSERTVTSATSANTDKQTRVVPAFDAKLGLDYTVPFRNDSSRMTIEAGYQLTQYLDAVDRMHPNSPPLETASSSYTTKTSSVGFNGPYLSLNFKI